MSVDSADDGSLVGWYRARIGEPSTADEAVGYWVFALGVVLGVAGLLAFLPSESASMLREGAIVLAAAGLVLLVAGPIVRLPLQRTATLLVYLGLLLSAASLAWFTVVFPNEWLVATGNQPVIVLYAAGLLVMGLGGVAVPILTDRAELEAERSRLSQAVDDLGRELADAEADEADLAAVVTELREAVRDTAADEDDLARAVAALRGELADSRADEDDLARAVLVLREELDDSRADEADLGRVVAALHGELEEADAEEADLEDAVEGLRAALVATSAERDDAMADEADLAAQLRSLRTSQSRFELYRDRSEEFRWRLRHRNGNIIAEGGEGYTRRHNAQKGMAAVRRDALGATVVFEETVEELPEEEAPFEPVEEVESQATVELYTDRAGEHRWRLRHDNGNVLADSGEGYDERRSARTAIDRLREYVGPAQYLRADPTAFELFRDAAGEWRWRLIHRNGNILADGGEGYTRRRDARRAVDGLRERVAELEPEVYEDSAGEYRWRIVAANGNVLADSGEGYGSRDAAADAAEGVRGHTPDADVLDVGSAAFEVFEDRNGEFRWRLRHRNGNILADSGEGYADRSGAHDAIESVKRNGPNAELEEIEVD